jgi:hypothetical protein
MIGEPGIFALSTHGRARRQGEVTVMDRTPAYLAAAAVIVGAASFPAKAAEVTIETYSCRDLLRETGSERDVAIAFMHGYVLGRGNAAKFEVETLRKQSAAFIERCLDDPKQPALETMRKSAAGADAPARSP